MGEINGVDRDDEEELAIRDIARLAAREPRVIESVTLADDADVFEQRLHDDIIKSLDMIAQGWIAQLKHVRASTEQLEKMVLATLGRVSSDVSEMHLLGVAVTREAQRGEEACSHLAKQLDKLLTVS
jgi:hypothetical protein